MLAAAGGAGLVASWLTTEHFLPWVSWHAEAVVFLTVVCIAAATLFSRSGAAAAARIPVPWPALPWLLLPVLAAAQCAAGVMTYWGDALVLALYAALAVACLVLGFQAGAAGAGGSDAADHEAAKVPTVLAWATLAGGLVSVLIALLQVFDLGHGPWVARMPELRRPGGNLVQPNQLATLLALAAASAAFLHARGRLSGLLAVAFLLVLGLGIAITESRTGILEVAVLLAWWQWRGLAAAAGASRWAAPGLAAAFAACVVGWPLLLGAIDMLGTEPAHRLAASAPRLRGWEQLIEASLRSPWWGWGALEVAEAHNAVVHTHAVSQAFTYSHNAVLDLALWFGWPVALAMSGVAAVWLARRLPAAQTGATWYCLAALLALGVHAMLEYPFAYAYFLAPCLVLLGWHEGRRGAAPWVRVGRLPARLAVAALASVLAWSVVEYLLIEEDFRVVRFQHLRMGTTPIGHEVPDVVLFSQLGALLRGSRIPAEPGLTAQELATLRDLALRYPWQATQYRYALALALNGQQDEAARQLKVLQLQRGELAFAGVRHQLAELAATRYPQLSTLRVP